MEAAFNHTEMDRRWRPALLSYFMRRVRNHAEAEDLTQELLTRLLRQEGTEFSSPEAYIFRMASNLLADRARRQMVRTQYRESLSRHDEIGVDTLDPFRVVAGRAELSKVAQILEELPERTRKIFILYRFENLRQEVIAQNMGISVSAVKKHVARAMASLMQAVESPK